MSENQSISLSQFNTPDTEKSTTMKPAKRKIDNIVIDNMSNLNNVDVENIETKTDISDVPIKNIKKERVSFKITYLILIFVIKIYPLNIILCL